MSLFNDQDIEWKKATAKPRIPPPTLRGNIFQLGTAQVDLSKRDPPKCQHQERSHSHESKSSQDARKLHSRQSSLSSPNQIVPSKYSAQSEREPADQTSSKPPSYMRSYSPHALPEDPSDFAPDASDVITSCPTYASSGLEVPCPENFCSSPTYVREASPPAIWTSDTDARHGQHDCLITGDQRPSPTYSYISPPYIQPFSDYLDSTAPNSPTYAPRSNLSAESLSPVDSVNDSLTPSAYVEWLDSSELEPPQGLEELRHGLQIMKIEMCDCVKDFRASPTADYGMLASRDLAINIKELKSFFDDKERTVMWDATQRSNKWELLGKKGSHIFMKRHAVQMAELDWLFNLTSRQFSNVVGAESSSHDGLLYFVDLCAGPGCFTEYIYWRRQKSARGWGFTLKGEQDFRIDKFNATSPAYKFRPCYGDPKEGSNGDITMNANIRHFANLVETDTQGRGVMLVTADGDADESGEYLRQEWNMRQLVLCQATVALHVLRKDGNFVLKVFDIFTPFMHDLLYLIGCCFTKVTIVKPLTSRPANSERFFVCLGLKERNCPLASFLLEVNSKFAEGVAQRGGAEIVRLVVPDLVPLQWTNFVRQSNIRIGEVQVEALREAVRYCGDPELSIMDIQTQVATELLSTWGIPSTIPASIEFIKSAKTTRASRWAPDKFLFKFDPSRDEPRKPKQQDPAENKSALLDTKIVSPSTANSSTISDTTMGQGHRTAADSGVKALDQISLSSDPLSAAPKSKKSTGPNLNDSAIKALLEKRAELARVHEQEAKERERAAAEARQSKQIAAAQSQSSTAQGGKKKGSDAAKQPKANKEVLSDAQSGERQAQSQKKESGPVEVKEKRSESGLNEESRSRKKMKVAKDAQDDEDEEHRLRREKKEAKRRRKAEKLLMAASTADGVQEETPPSNSLKIRVKINYPDRP